MKQPVSLQDSIINTVSFEFISGIARNLFKPHRTGWRIFPYTVIVCTFDSEYKCEIKNEDIYTITAGQAVIVPGGIQHRMIFEKTGNLNYLHIKFTVFNSMDVLSLYEIPRIINNTDRYPLSSMVDEISGNLTDGGIPLKNIFRIKGIILTVLNVILEKASEKKDVALLMTRIKILLPVLEYIRENLDKDISRKTLASIMSLSETRFHYVFKTIMKMPPIKYLQDQRLQKAYTMIASTQKSLGRIASSVGYSDYSRFSKQFKTHFGETSSDTRERLHKDLTLVLS